MISIIGISIITLSCGSSAVPSTPFPVKYPPAYFVEFQFTPEQKDLPFSTVKVARGSSVTIIATIMWVGTAIDLRLVLNSVVLESSGTTQIMERLPDFITFETSLEYVRLEPGDSVNIPITFTIAESATTGSYIIGFLGQQKQPVKERSDSGNAFRLQIIN
jgi:hypothetical protein